MSSDPSSRDHQEPEGPDCLPDQERRDFLKIGLVITGVFAGGTILSVVSHMKTAVVSRKQKSIYPYKPHYSMVIRHDRCIGCERCVKGCIAANQVPDYGWRTLVLEREEKEAIGQKREFIPILCNQCNNPPCVRTCPTRATYKDKTNGIVMMDNKKCIGCKSCMIACPYDMRYFNEEKGAIDKCDFCFATRLSKGQKTTACAEACPADVRIFGDLSDPQSRVYRLVHQLQETLWVMRKETGALPNVFYKDG